MINVSGSSTTTQVNRCSARACAENRSDVCSDLAGDRPDLFELETQLVLEPGQVKPGDRLRIRLANGELDATVEDG